MLGSSHLLESKELAQNFTSYRTGTLTFQHNGKLVIKQQSREQLKSLELKDIVCLMKYHLELRILEHNTLTNDRSTISWGTPVFLSAIIHCLVSPRTELPSLPSPCFCHI